MSEQELIDAIRGATDLRELKRMVGPSASENEAAKRRIEKLDSLQDKCGFSNPSGVLSMSEHHYRDMYDKINAEQIEFENAYC